MILSPFVRVNAEISRVSEEAFFIRVVLKFTFEFRVSIEILI